MSTATDDSLQTRQSLLSRLRDLDDHESWRTFFDLYWKLLYNVARRAGLDDAVAQDVVQETVIGVAREMPEFRYDPSRGSFKQWLLRITRRRIIDHLRRIYRQPLRVEVAPDSLDEDETQAATIADTCDGHIDSAWDEEWERSIFEEAVARVRQAANPKHFQVFDYCVLKEWPVSKAAATLGLNAAQVYVAKHRVAQAVKRAARQIKQQRSNGESG